MEDALGIRMKESYEFASRSFLPRRTYTIIRLDGKAFHSYTKGLDRPFDRGLMEDMAHTAAFLCRNIAGAKFAFTQSDEISLLLTDFDSIKTEPWFGGNVQKIVSVSASLCTEHFNSRRDLRHRNGSKRAYFDARVFTIPDPTEVANYFIWRQKDATRNSISIAAQRYFTTKDLHSKSSAEKQEMLWKYAHINWNDYPIAFKRGQLVARVPELMEYYVKPVQEGCRDPGKVEKVYLNEPVVRQTWQLIETPIFTQGSWLQDSIPTYQSVDGDDD